MNTFFAVAVLLLSVLSPVQDEDVVKSMMEDMIGVWEADYEFPGYGMVHEKATYTWGDGEYTLNAEVEVYSGDQLADRSTGVFWYDPEKTKFFAESSSDNGMSSATSESLNWDETYILMEGKVQGAPFDLHQVRITLVDKNTINVKMYVPGEGDEWTQMLDVSYTRVE